MALENSMTFDWVESRVMVWLLVRSLVIRTSAKMTMCVNSWKMHRWSYGHTLAWLEDKTIKPSGYTCSTWLTNSASDKGDSHDWSFMIETMLVRQFMWLRGRLIEVSRVERKLMLFGWLFYNLFLTYVFLFVIVFPDFLCVCCFEVASGSTFFINCLTFSCISSSVGGSPLLLIL